MKAVMYGGGNIGRGFIGMLFSKSGYDVTFVDVAEPVVNELNEKQYYMLRYVSTEGHTDEKIENVCAVNGNDTDAVADAIANADVMATAVGVRILKFIIPNLVAGIRKRMAEGKGPLNIIICENLIDADKLLKSMIEEQLTEEEKAWFVENIGLVEASIGRMVPVQTEEMKDGEPLRVCVEEYGYLPVDKAAFKGGIPNIKNMVPYEPFSYYIQRKLYVHNMGHAICAYLGDYLGCEYIYQAIADTEVKLIVENAMVESALALAAEYNMDMQNLIKHVKNLVMRFSNAALKDTCARVGGDPERKLSPNDRLIGSAKMAVKHGIYPGYIMTGIAAGVLQYLKEKELEQTEANVIEVLKTVSEVEEGSILMEGVLKQYKLFTENASLNSLQRAAEVLEQDNTEVIA